MQAKEYFERLIEITPEDPIAWYNLAEVYEQLSSTTKRLEKIDILSKFLKHLNDVKNIIQSSNNLLTFATFFILLMSFIIIRFKLFSELSNSMYYSGLLTIILAVCFP